MTFETLNLIHQLLALEEENRRGILQRARNRLYELEDKNENLRDIEDARVEKDFANKLHAKALNALNEFESHEWH